MKVKLPPLDTSNMANKSQVYEADSDVPKKENTYEAAFDILDLQEEGKLDKSKATAALVALGKHNEAKYCHCYLKRSYPHLSDAPKFENWYVYTLKKGIV